MPDLIANEECELCLGTGWVKEPPIVLGQNDDLSDILSEPKIYMCRCTELKVIDPEALDEDWDDENVDESNDPRTGGSLVLA